MLEEKQGGEMKGKANDDMKEKKEVRVIKNYKEMEKQGSAKEDIKQEKEVRGYEETQGKEDER